MTRAGWQELGPLLLLLSGCPNESTGPASGAAGTSLAPPDGPACSEVECAALAGVCQAARCDASLGVCRTSAAHEGKPCLEGNACGTSECRSGECVPLAPPACSELSDVCHVGVCRPDTGCVAEPRAVPGMHEENAVQLPSSGVGHITTSSACQEQAFAPFTCADGLTGPSAFFALDLSEATELTQAHLVVDAAFPFEAALTRGPSGDPAVLHCAEPFYADGTSRRLSAELERGLYHLVVTGSSEADRGEIRVASVVGALDGAGPPPNDDCATPRVLDGAIEQQTVVLTAAGATRQGIPRCNPVGSADVFFELDLSERPADVMLDVNVEELDAENGIAFTSASLFAPGNDTCTEILTCGRSWSRRLSPGIHKLALHVDQSDLAAVLAMRVRLSEGSCPSPVNDSPETALALDPLLATQRLRGNTACGNDDVSTACSDDRGAPDLFYRLDLRNHAAPQLLQFRGEYASGLLSYVMTSSGDTEGLRPTRCEDAGVHFVLAPRLYYLVIDGSSQNAGVFDLELRREDEATVPRACLPRIYNLGHCLLDSEPACGLSIAHPDCMLTALECGLASNVYATFCTAYPGCCDGSEPTESCEGPWEAAIICPP